MDKKTTALVKKMQRQEDADMRFRAERVIRAIKGVGHHFRADEMLELETVAERAFGRLSLSRR